MPTIPPSITTLTIFVLIGSVLLPGRAQSATPIRICDGFEVEYMSMSTYRLKEGRRLIAEQGTRPVYYMSATEDYYSHTYIFDELIIPEIPMVIRNEYEEYNHVVVEYSLEPTNFISHEACSGSVEEYRENFNSALSPLTSITEVIGDWSGNCNFSGTEYHSGVYYGEVDWWHWPETCYGAGDCTKSATNEMCFVISPVPNGSKECSLNVTRSREFTTDLLMGLAHYDMASMPGTNELAWGGGWLTRPIWFGAVGMETVTRLAETEAVRSLNEDETRINLSRVYYRITTGFPAETGQVYELVWTEEHQAADGTNVEHVLRSETLLGKGEPLTTGVFVMEPPDGNGTNRVIFGGASEVSFTGVTFNVASLVPDGVSTAVASVAIEPEGAAREVLWEIFDAEGDDRLGCAIDPETGVITAGEQAGFLLVRASDRETPCIYAEEILEVGCGSCSGEQCAAGAGKVSNQSVGLTVSLGRTADGRSAGRLRLSESAPHARIYRPEALRYGARASDIEVIRDEGRALRQIRTCQVLADIVTLNDFAYEIRCYPAAAATVKSNDVYLSVGNPYVTWLIEDPDAGTNGYRRVFIDERLAGQTNRNLFAWSDTAQGWDLSQGDGLRTVRRETTWDLAADERTESLTVEGPGGEIVSRHVTVARVFPWGERTVREIADPDGEALTTEMFYYYDPEEPGRYGRIRAVVHADGSWTAYDYDERGRRTQTRRPWKDAAYAEADNDAAVRMISEDYTPVDPADIAGPSDARVRTRIEYALGIPVSRTYHAYSVNGAGEEVQATERCARPDAVYGDMDNLRTVTTLFPAGTQGPEAGKTRTVVSPGGGMASYVYERGIYLPDPEPGLCAFVAGTGEATRETVTQGTVGRPEGIPYVTTRTVSVRDERGLPILNETYIFDGTGYQRTDWTVRVYDATGRPIRTHHADGTMDEIVWSSCCGKESETDRTGAQTLYTYDALGRLETQLLTGTTDQPDLLARFEYDAAGRDKVAVYSAGGLSMATTNRYDAAGRLIETSDSSGATYILGFEQQGRVRTTLHPGGATERSEVYLDGRTRSETGSAIPDVVYDYGVGPDGMRWTLRYDGGPGATAWEKTVIDALGRTVRIERPGPAGTVVSLSTYDLAGRLVRTETTGTPPTLFVYDEAGRPYRQGTDIDRDGALRIYSMDRITESDSRYERVDGDWWRTSGQIVYPDDYSGIAATTSVQRQRLTGFTGGLIEESAAYDVHGNESRSATTLDRANRTVTVTASTAGSASNRVTVTVNGLVRNERTSAGGVVTYMYDALGRPVERTWPGGATETHYDEAGRIDFVEGAGGLKTGYAYDAAGRVRSVTDPLSNTTYYAYDENGSVESIWGPSVYPVRFGYDERGRRTSMETYRGGAGWDGPAWPADTGPADRTEWRYDTASGLLTAKVDAANHEVRLSYTPDGKLLSRQWARGALTTYAYDDSGALERIAYDDGTPPVTYTHDRLGRVKAVTDAAGTRRFDYNPALQLETETIISAYTTTVHRLYEQDGPGETPGRNAGLMFGSDYRVDYGYDPVGRVDSVGFGPHAVRYAYVPGTERIETVTRERGVSSLFTTTRTYDEQARLTRTRAVMDPTFSPLPAAEYGYAHDDRNLRTKLTLPDGSFWDYVYDARGQLTGAARQWTDGTDVAGQGYGYAYDHLGNRDTAARRGPVLTNRWDYTVNSLNQYTRRTVPDVVKVIGDAHPDATVTVNNEPTVRQDGYFQANVYADNRTTAAYSAVTVAAVRNDMGPNGEDAVAGSTGYLFIPRTPEVFDYDEDGNLLRDGRWDYTWRGENRLAAMETRADLSPDVPRLRLEFDYDYQGRRCSKRVYERVADTWSLTANHTFLYDGWNLIAEFTDTPALSHLYTNHFYWGLDLSGTFDGAGGVGGLLAQSAASDTTYYATYDGNGNVVTLIDAATGEQAAVYEYDPFGAILRRTGSVPGNPFTFSTKYTDPETSLLYYGYRYLNPSTARWLNRDPAGELGGRNLYAFVNNSPPNAIDPRGLALYAFDGTGARYETWTHVSVLHRSYQERAFYAEGVGSRWYSSLLGGIFGVGGQGRLVKMYSRLVASYKAGDRDIDIVGFSRGASLAREFANMIKERGIVERTSRSEHRSPRDRRSRRRSEETIIDCSPVIRFVGLFDTVGSFGIPANDINVGIRMALPRNVQNAAHAVARDEHRREFPLTPLNEAIPGQDFSQRVFRGDHSDIGGGHKANQNLLTLAPLFYIHSRGVDAGVPFGPLNLIKEKDKLLLEAGGERRPWTYQWSLRSHNLTDIWYYTDAGPRQNLPTGN